MTKADEELAALGVEHQAKMKALEEYQVDFDTRLSTAIDNKAIELAAELGFRIGLEVIARTAHYGGIKSGMLLKIEKIVANYSNDGICFWVNRKLKNGEWSKRLEPLLPSNVAFINEEIEE